MSKTNATQHSLKYLRDEGWICHVVEKYIKHPGMPFGKRIDAFGIGDILACRPPKWELRNYKPEIVRPAAIALVQCFPDTGGTVGFNAHREKILAIPAAATWIQAGGKIFLQGWKLRGKKGRKRWLLREEEVVFRA